MSKTTKVLSILKYLAGLGLGVGLMWLAFRNVDIDELWAKIQQANRLYIVLALTAGLAAHYVRGYRWKMLLEASGYTVSATNTFAAVMVAYMVNNALPRAGELARCSVLVRTNQIPFVVNVGTVVTERAVDVISLLCFLILIFVLEVDRVLKLLGDYAVGFQNLSWTVPIFAVGFMVVVAVVIWRLKDTLLQIGIVRKVWDLVAKLVESALAIRKVKSVPAFLVATALIWVGYVLATWFAMLALPETAELGLYFAFMVTMIGGIGMAIPIPGGVGSFHTAVQKTFALFGLSETVGLTLALFLHTPQLVLNVVVGALGYFYLILQTPKSQSKTQE